jgi:hypothetical protein
VSSLTSFVSDAFEDHIEFLSVSVVIDGVSYEALPAEAEIAPDLEMGGVSDQADGAVIIKVSDLSDVPKVGRRIDVGGSISRIRAINRSAGNPLMVIEYTGFTER